MPQILLVRHGQASLGKSNYDELSETGYRQAEILGRHLADLDWKPELVINGSMQRHKQTADSITKAWDSTDILRDTNPDWNEFDFEGLIRAYLDELGADAPKPSSPSEFFSALRKALIAWSEQKITTPLAETWFEFASRTANALADTVQREHSRILVVSSGGAISMVVKHILGLPDRAMVDLNLQSKNTGMTELFAKKNDCYVSSLNHVSHLSSASHKSLITHA